MKYIPNNPRVYGLLSNCGVKVKLFVSIPPRSIAYDYLKTNSSSYNY